MKAKLSHMQIIALGFMIMIAVGTALLLLPVSTRSGERADFLTALFTATSASCVTGLVLRDTGSYWSGFGQTVIICLIQIGGLGFMTISTVFFMLLRRRVGLRQREVTVESLNSTQIGGILRLIKLIVKGTLIFELAGAILLSFRFVSMFGPGRGIFYGIFHAVSAFCNAGFDLMGVIEPYSSFTYFSDDVLVNAVLMALIIIGGLGFTVWDDIFRKGLRWKRYSLQTKVVLTGSAVFVFGGALLMWIFENGKLNSEMSGKEQLLTALFGSVTARTAGFNTVDTAALSQGSRLLTIMLMVVGGSPGSTAGGVKTTTIVVIFIYCIAGIRHEQEPHIFGRTLKNDPLKKAVSVLFFNVGLALVGTLLICALQEFELCDVLFETFSAIGTVGMTVGITRDLCTVSRIVIAVLMYLGRVGSVSFAVALLEKRARPAISYPAEELTIG